MTYLAYNLSQLRILWEIASDGLIYENIINSSSAAYGDFGVYNLKSDIVEQVWRTTNTANGYFQIDCGENNGGPTKSVIFDTIAFLNHNFTPAAKINIWGWGASNQSAPTVSALKSNGTKIVTDLKPVDDVNEKNVIWVSPTEVSGTGFRHYLIQIEDPNNADGYLQLGRFVAGAATIFTTEENFTADFTFQEVSYKDEVKINGFTSISSARSLKKKMTVEFKNLNGAPHKEDGTKRVSNYSNFKKYARYCRDTLKALIIPDARAPYLFSLYAKMSETPVEKCNFLDENALYVNMDVEWDEAK
jgi:hypothetical protein